MQNGRGSRALEFHEATKHSRVSVRASAHYLDWENKPGPFKLYTGVPLQDLTTEFLRPALNALLSISGGVPKERASASMGVDTLAELLFFSAGITREFRVPGRGTFYMRAAPATGALYPIEIYVVCRDLEGLKAGVYHFSPGDFSLARLRSGDWTPALSSYAGSRADVSAAPASIILTSIAWRNSWKYQARSYRHWFWDGGVIAANLPSDGQLGRASLVGGPRLRGRSRQRAPRPEGEAGGGDRDMPGWRPRCGCPARQPGVPGSAPTPNRPILHPALSERGGLPGGLGSARGLLSAGFQRGEGMDRRPSGGGTSSPVPPPSDPSYPLDPTMPRPDEGPDLAQVILRRGFDAEVLSRADNLRAAVERALSLDPGSPARPSASRGPCLTST